MEVFRPSQSLTLLYAYALRFFLGGGGDRGNQAGYFPSLSHVLYRTDPFITWELVTIDYIIKRQGPLMSHDIFGFVDK